MSILANLKTVMAEPDCSVGCHLMTSGMSEVYKVQADGGWSAVKVARTDVTDAQKALHNEARILQEIGPHPNIVSFRSCGEVDGSFYVELEHLDDDYFGDLYDSEPLDESDVVDVARGIAAALAHVHAKGYLHMDVKPDNFWLGDVPKLFDFGLAEKMGSPHPGVKCMYVTPAFTSIYRILTDQPSTFKDDIFALGVSLYTMCRGVCPFEFATDWDWKNKGSERFATQWVGVYEELLGSLNKQGFSDRFELLLTGLITFYTEEPLYNGGAVVDFMTRLFR
jgi:serine/threonine protein kinase